MRDRKPWSPEEDRKLSGLWGRVTPKIIAYRIGRSPVAVVERAARLELGPNPYMRRSWSEEDVVELRRLWGGRDLLTIARRLGRTPNAVAMKAKKLKLGLPHRVTGPTIGELVRESGWSRNKLVAAIADLGIELKEVQSRSDPRAKRGRRKVVPLKDVSRLLEHVEERPRIFRDAPGSGRTTRGAWGVGKKPAKCLGCGTTKRPHYAKGRCGRCYDRGIQRARLRRGADVAIAQGEPAPETEVRPQAGEQIPLDFDGAGDLDHVRGSEAGQ